MNRKISTAALLLAGLIFGVVPPAQAELATVRIDCDKDTASVTAPGYTRLLKTNRFDQSTQITLSDGAGRLAG